MTVAPTSLSYRSKFLASHIAEGYVTRICLRCFVTFLRSSPYEVELIVQAIDEKQRNLKICDIPLDEAGFGVSDCSGRQI